MWEYKIRNTDLGYKITREKDDIVEYLDVKGNWNENKTWAKIYYHRDDAVGALVIRKAQGERVNVDPQPKSVEPKKSWGELS